MRTSFLGPRPCCPPPPPLHKYHPLTIQNHFDFEEDFGRGCRDVSHCQQQFFSEQQSPDLEIKIFSQEQCCFKVQNFRSKLVWGRSKKNIKNIKVRMWVSLTCCPMVYNATELSSNTVFFRASKLKPFKNRLTARKLIKDLERQAKINFNNLRSKVAPRRNILGATSLTSVAFCTFATANFEPWHRHPDDDTGQTNYTPGFKPFTK